MSYQSKYTGPEIDNLLDQINVGGGQYTTLWEGTAKSLDTTFTLVDSVENYDMILVLGGRLYDDKNYSNTTSCLVPAQLLKEGGCLQGQTIRTGAYGNSSYNYTIAVKFTSNTTFVIGEIKEVGWIGACVYRICGIRLGGSVGSASNPIGAIVPIMGTTAPKDHLICNGSELNINEYKELADYFEKQFGSKNHFGGDGVNTFAIPDLRNEFLRGYHGEAEKQLSGEIGIHQDATEHPEVWAWNGNTNVSSLEINLRSTNTNTYGNISANKDTELQFIPGGRRSAHYSGSIATNNSTDLCEAYTSRPTNVAVLFCIKYTESASAGSGSTYKEVDLISEPVEYNMGTSVTSISQNLVFNDSVTNYNEVVFIVDVYHSSNKAYYARTNVRILVSGITFNDSDAAGADGNSFYLNIAYGIGLDSKYQMGATNAFTAGVHFRNETTLRIRNTTCTIAGYTKFRIVAVKGIKY